MMRAGGVGMTTDPLPGSVAPEALTLALRRGGVFGEGRVSEVTVESARATVLSRITRLRLTYDGDAPGAPPTLIFKTGLPERLTSGWGRLRGRTSWRTRSDAF
jgi:hypothetical protein